MDMHHKTLSGVVCNVKDCHFNDLGGNCTANAIRVSSCQGSGCEGTLCSTFVDKKDCDGCR